MLYLNEFSLSLLLTFWFSLLLLSLLFFWWLLDYNSFAVASWFARPASFLLRRKGFELFNKEEEFSGYDEVRNFFKFLDHFDYFLARCLINMEDEIDDITMHPLLKQALHRCIFEEHLYHLSVDLVFVDAIVVSGLEWSRMWEKVRIKVHCYGSISHIVYHSHSCLKVLMHVK